MLRVVKNMKIKMLTNLGSLMVGMLAAFTLEPSQAQTIITPGATFATNDNSPAIRAAYSTFSIGGASHNISIEVIYPHAVIPQGYNNEPNSPFSKNNFTLILE
jgi:hypothetical protein